MKTRDGHPAPRRRSIIYNGYPGEDLLVERTQEESEPPMTTMSYSSNPVEAKTLLTISSRKNKRPSFLAEYLRSSPEGENALEEVNEKNSQSGPSPEL